MNAAQANKITTRGRGYIDSEFIKVQEAIARAATARPVPLFETSVRVPHELKSAFIARLQGMGFTCCEILEQDQRDRIIIKWR